MCSPCGAGIRHSCYSHDDVGVEIETDAGFYTTSCAGLLSTIVLLLFCLIYTGFDSIRFETLSFEINTSTHLSLHTIGVLKASTWNPRLLFFLARYAHSFRFDEILLIVRERYLPLDDSHMSICSVETPFLITPIESRGPLLLPRFPTLFARL